MAENNNENNKGKKYYKATIEVRNNRVFLSINLEQDVNENMDDIELYRFDEPAEPMLTNPIIIAGKKKNNNRQ